jgi:hypothetical protein
MNVDVSAVLSQNITLLYDALDLKTVDSKKLKVLMDVEGVLMDTPEMIVALFPAVPLIIQMGDRRARITLQQESQEIGSTPLWDIAYNCSGIAQESGAKLIAYGFNYDLGVQAVDGDAQLTTLELFLSNRQALEDILGGHFFSFVPRLRFRRDETSYDLILEPLDARRIKVHLNAHFDVDELPSKEQLEDSFRREFAYLISILPELFLRR